MTTDALPGDPELVAAARSGDAASLGVLLERHRAGMLVVALSLLGHRSEAHDAVQEAMFIALRRLGDLRDPEAAGPWLRSIVRNTCRMQLRRERSTGYLAPTGPASDAAEFLPEAILERHALRDWLWQAIEALSEPLQLVVLLRYFSGVFSYEEMAGLCGVPVGTVRSRLHQARSRLGTMLLEAVDEAHPDARMFVNRRQREVMELFAAAEQGDFGRATASTWSSELTMVGPDGAPSRGRDAIVKIMEADLAAGVRQRPLQVTASHRFTIIEAALLSPPWDPTHCPPGVVWLLTMNGEQVARLRLFHPATTGHVTP